MLCYLQSGPLSGSALNKGLQLGKIGVLLSDRAQRRASDHQEHPLIDLNYLWQGHVALSQSENLRPLRDPTLPKTLLLFYHFSPAFPAERCPRQLYPHENFISTHEAVRLCG